MLFGAVVLVLVACANIADLLLARSSRDYTVRAAFGARARRCCDDRSPERGARGGGRRRSRLLGVAALRRLVPRACRAPTASDRLAGHRVHRPIALVRRAALRAGAGAPRGHMLQRASAARRRAASAGLRRDGHRRLALALMLVVGAGLLIRSFARLSAVDPAFEPRASRRCVSSYRRPLPGVGAQAAILDSQAGPDDSGARAVGAVSVLPSARSASNTASPSR